MTARAKEENENCDVCAEKRHPTYNLLSCNPILASYGHCSTFEILSAATYDFLRIYIKQPTPIIGLFVCCQAKQHPSSESHYRSTTRVSFHDSLLT